MRFALILGYPLCVHVAVLLGWPVLRVLAVGLLAAGILLPALREGSGLAWSAWLLLVLAAVALDASGRPLYLLYLPPIALPLLLLVGFARSLKPGNVPLVTAIALQVHGSLPPDIERYTRRVTSFWSVVLLALSMLSAVLATCADPVLWSAFSNGINYLLVAACFMAEYGYRRWRFRDFDQPGLRAYLGIVWRARPRAGRHG